MNLFAFGELDYLGGAATELWDTIKLWRRAGWGVTLISRTRPTPPWPERLAEWGVSHATADPERLARLSVRGNVAVGVCSTAFRACYPMLKHLDARCVWVGCMTHPQAAMLRAIKRHGPCAAHVFQSHYQRHQLEPVLRGVGYDPSQGYLIRGAFDLARPTPAIDATPGVVTIGRLSRAAPDKFSPHTWTIYETIRQAAAERGHTVRARVMGFDRQVERVTGPPPTWIETLPPGAEPPERFLASLDCLVQPGGTAIENWPRVGLEAMHLGVPLVVDAAGGWHEMLEHGQTGMLCRTEDEFVKHTLAVLDNQRLRRSLVKQACRALAEHADASRITSQWRRLFQEITA
jgi:hypothetical protein